MQSNYILVINDNVDACLSATWFLRGKGLKVLNAISDFEASEVLRRHGCKVQLILFAGSGDDWLTKWPMAVKMKKQSFNHVPVVGLLGYERIN